jgi:hypothetical protein
VSDPTPRRKRGGLSSPRPPQLQQRPPRFCGGLPHRTYAPAPQTTRCVAALRPIYDHRRHVAAPFWRHWRHRHSRVHPLQRTTTFVAHCSSQLRGRGAGEGRCGDPANGGSRCPYAKLSPIGCVAMEERLLFTVGQQGADP